MTCSILIGLFSVLSLGAALHKGIYNGYEAWSVIPQTEDQVHIVYQLSKDDELDFWTEAGEQGAEAQIMVPPHKLGSTRQYLEEAGLSIDVFITNVERLVSEEMEAIEKRKLLRARAFDYDDFNTYEQIMEEMEEMVGRCRNDLGIFCETYSIGQSAEGRDLKMLRIYKNEANRQLYWMDSQIHAREWLAVATNMKIANHIITNYDSSSEVQQLMNDGDWYFLFVQNPDGYVYSWTTSRLWRKNRSVNSGSSCRGVDLNRNYEQKWGNAGTSSNPCSSVYRGPSPVSEPETQAVQREILRLSPNMKAFNTIHTAARIILMPWGSLLNPADRNSCEYLPEPEHSVVDFVAKAMARSIQDTYGHSSWRGGNSCATIYPASGLTQDYARAFGGVSYSFTPELRDRDAFGQRYGFTPPASEINPSFVEMWNGFVTMVDSINMLEELQ